MRLIDADKIKIDCMTNRGTVAVSQSQLANAPTYELNELLEKRDKQIRADAFDEIERAMYHQAFNIDHEEDGLQKWDSGNWIRYKLFENVLEQLKEHK